MCIRDREDPIEYVHRHEGCIVTQREIPSDVATYAEEMCIRDRSIRVR